MSDLWWMNAPTPVCSGCGRHGVADVETGICYECFLRERQERDYEMERERPGPDYQDYELAEAAEAKLAEREG